MMRDRTEYPEKQNSEGGEDDTTQLRARKLSRPIELTLHLASIYTLAFFFLLKLYMIVKAKLLPAATYLRIDILIYILSTRRTSFFFAFEKSNARVCVRY